MINTAEEFIAKLEKIPFTVKSSDGQSISTTDGKWKFGYQIKLHSSRHSGMFPPIQMIPHLLYNGSQVQYWGCMENEDTALFVDWFLAKKGKIQDYDWDLKRESEKDGKKIFNAL